MSTPLADDALVLSGADLQAFHDAQLALLTPGFHSADGLHPCSTAVSRLLDTPYAAICLRHQGTWHVGASCADLGSRLLASLRESPSAFTLSGYPYTVTVHAQTGRGEGMIWAAFASSASLHRSGQARLDMLVPALQSRVQQPSGARMLLTTMEALGGPLAVYGADGVALCHSSAFQRRLRSEPECEQIYAAAQRLAVQICAAPPDRPDATSAQPQVVQTAKRRYELHGSRVSRQLMPEPAALINLRVARGGMPSKGRLCRRLGLTEREAEVALLVAEGLTSKEIAQRLCVSTNTIRRHGEKVLEKLGLHTRAGVAMALMREG